MATSKFSNGPGYREVDFVVRIVFDEAEKSNLAAPKIALGKLEVEG